MSKQPILEKEYILKKRVVILLLIGICAVFPMNAANVSILVIESGRMGEFPGNQYPIIWENSLMDVFFDSGHIVSNAPMIRLPEKPADGLPDETKEDFELAREGGMEFFLVAIVDYAVADVSLRLFSVKSRQMIREQKYKIKTFHNTKAENDDIKAAIRIMIAHM